MLSPLDVFKDLASSAVDGYVQGDMWCLVLTLLVRFMWAAKVSARAAQQEGWVFDSL